VPWELLQIPLILPAFALVLARVSGLMIVAPILGSAAIPARVRAFFAVVLALLVFPTLLPTVSAELSLSAAVVGLTGELMIGAVLGLGLSLLFVSLELAGLMIAQQAGFALAEIFDPMLGMQSTAFGQVYFVCGLFIFVAVGGLRAMVQALLDTFQTLPPLSFTADEAVAAVLVDLLAGAMIVALRLAGPALTALMLTALAKGFISRTMPQLNILAVGFSTQIAVALLVMAATVGVLEPLVTTHLWDSLDALVDLLRRAA